MTLVQSASQKRRVVQKGVARSHFQHFTLGILGRLEQAFLDKAFREKL